MIVRYEWMALWGGGGIVCARAWMGSGWGMETGGVQGVCGFGLRERNGPLDEERIFSDQGLPAFRRLLIWEASEGQHERFFGSCRAIDYGYSGHVVFEAADCFPANLRKIFQ